MDAGDAQRLEEAPRDLDDLGVQRRRPLADALDPDLGELVLASGLRTLGAKERARVVQANRAHLLVEMRAEHRAQRARRSPPGAASATGRPGPRR